MFRTYPTLFAAFAVVWPALATSPAEADDAARGSAIRPAPATEEYIEGQLDWRSYYLYRTVPGYRPVLSAQDEQDRFLQYPRRWPHVD